LWSFKVIIIVAITGCWNPNDQLDRSAWRKLVTTATSTTSSWRERERES